MKYKQGIGFLSGSIGGYIVYKVLDYFEPQLVNTILNLRGIWLFLFSELLLVGGTCVGILLIYREKIGWLKSEDSEEKLSDYELQGKIKHTQKLNLTYRRLCTLTAQKNNKDELILCAFPLVRRFDELQGISKEERDKIILDEASQPSTDIRYIQDLGDALKHLENKEYKKIYNLWKKSDKLLKRYQDKKDEKIVTELNNSLKNFNREVANLVDRIEQSNHILKGNCESCP